MTSAMTARFSRIDALVLLVMLVAFGWAYRNAVSSGPYTYDEADYMTAGSHGFAANYLERPSLSVMDFVKAGLNRGMQAGKRKSLSEWIRGSGDITFYRHFHGPVYFYWISAVGPLVHFDEAAMRRSGFVFHLLTFVAIYLGVLLLAERDARLAALLASFLFLFSDPDVGTASQITPHIPYVFFTTLSLLLFARFLQTGRFAWWHAALAACAFAFCSIEYAILLLITFAICLWIFRERLFGNCTRPQLVRFATRSIILFFGILLLLWPIGLLELSAIKSYFYIGYLALLRKGSFGTEPFYMIWWHRVVASPLEYGLAVVCGLFAAVRWRRLSSTGALLPFLIYAALMLLTTLKNTSLNPTYVSSILPAMAVVSGIVLAAWLGRLPAAPKAVMATILLVLIAIGGVWHLVDQQRRAHDFNLNQVLVENVRQSGSIAAIVVPYEYMPTISYYFPQMKVHPILPTDNAAAVLESVREGSYRNLVYAGQNEDELPRRLRALYRVDAQTLGPAGNGRQLFLYRLS